jgi:hypothetical protein
MACAMPCPNNYYPDAKFFCIACPGGSNGHCLSCDNTGCTACDPNPPVYRNKTGSICSCLTGYYENAGACLSCNTSYPFCKKCPNATYCEDCYDPFVPNGLGRCVCKPGLYLVNGACKPLPGCVLMNNITTGVYCEQCSSTLNFALAANQTCVCVNYTLYNSTTGKCDGVCGDGRSLDNICDDGDGIDTNGCANNCTINPQYHCTNPNKNAPSVCVPKRNFTIQYLYAVKDSASSTAFLYFSVSPDDATLSHMDLSALV